MTEQLTLFKTLTVPGMVTGKPIPQDKAVLYPMLIEPDHEASYHSYWSFSAETRKGWIFEIVRSIGYGSFNGTNLIYCQLTHGEIQEFGQFHLFPAKEKDILEYWGPQALQGYRERLNKYSSIS
jgi:hypothetical protein